MTGKTDLGNAQSVPNTSEASEASAHLTNKSINSVVYAGDRIHIEGEVRVEKGDFVVRDKINVGYTAEQVDVMLTRIKSDFQPKPFDGKCPYVGLLAFEEEDQDRFFGREGLVDDLIIRVSQSPFVVIAGPSGSGKSSVVRAGLIPQLKQGSLSKSEHWLYETLKPGRTPLNELARVVASLTGKLEAGNDIRDKGVTDSTILHRWLEVALKGQRNHRALILVDQFEELFTQVADEKDRVAFLALLIHAATVEDGQIIVLVTLRSDFVSNCALYPQLNDLLNQQFIQVGPMQGAELVNAIARPALQVGLRIDPELITQIANDVNNQPGALPLMQFALKDLFDTQQIKGGLIALTLDDYLARGGIGKALQYFADKQLSQLEPNEQILARSIFSSLIQVGRGSLDTRRTVAIDELTPSDNDQVKVRQLIDKLALARLITVDERDDKDVATISHERLIEAWPWLNQLVEENRHLIVMQNQIADDALMWQNNQCEESFLYIGNRLAQVLEQLATVQPNLGKLAQSFVETSINRQKAEEEKIVLARQQQLAVAQQIAQTQTLAATRLRWMLLASVGLGFAMIAVIGILLNPMIREWRAKQAARGELVTIPAGMAVIGTNDHGAEPGEKPEWRIHVPTLKIEKYEVSNAQYRLCIKYRGCSDTTNPNNIYDKAKANFPVQYLTIIQAVAYCRWIGRRLPTEIEWEYAARGESGRQWPWDNQQSLENKGCTKNQICEVSAFDNGSTPEGVYQLLGNVWEWTSSYYQESYDKYDVSLQWNGDPAMLVADPVFVVRGGSYQAALPRITYRQRATAYLSNPDYGVRCVEDL